MTGAIDATGAVDLLVVGSGGGGLTAALTAAAVGHKVLVIEKLPTLGGSTAISGGALWIPNSSLMREAGLLDSFEDAWKYLDTLIGEVSPATSPARKKTYIDAGSQLVNFLCAQGIQLRVCKDYPDYYASHPGGCGSGRSIESAAFDGKKLGADFDRLTKRDLIPTITILASELSAASNGIRTLAAIRTSLRVAWRTVVNMISGGKTLTMGMALIGQLIHTLQRYGVEMRTDTSLVKLLSDDQGRVIGALIRDNNGERAIHARDGVVLASGGFSRNAQMRSEHMPLSSTNWTHSSRGDEGDGIRAGVAVGAAVAQMDEAWWMPTSLLPDGTRHMCTFERNKPYSIMVDASGERFCNEAASYMEVGQKIFKREQEHGGAIPCWMIMDARHRQYYPFATWLAGRTPQSAIDAGYLITSDTLDELASRCKINAAGLAKTVERFNRMCVAGKDNDFRRGDDPYDRYYGDARVKPNPNLGAIEQAPFYAVAFYPGDIGTNGGLLTDEHARVLREDGIPITGLYATGNCTASVMGRIYPGAGGTIGPAMVFGYVGAMHAADHGGQSR